MNLILLEPGEVIGGEATLAGDRARHLRTVLKVTAGQSVRIGQIDGPLGTASVAGINDDRVTLRCAFDDATPPRPPVDLLLAVPRPKVLRRLWAQLAALGVGRIILTNAARVERPYFDTHVLTPACYRPLLIEGLQQARDTRLPIVTIHRQFRPLIEDHLDALAGDSLRVVGDPTATTPLGRVADGARTSSGQRALVAVGPEGGWNDFELSLLEAHRFERVTMGQRTLRSDTACIALLSRVHAALS